MRVFLLHGHSSLQRRWADRCLLRSINTLSGQRRRSGLRQGNLPIADNFQTTVDLLTVAIGVISSAAVTLGSAGYIQQFVGFPNP